jgi:hypothetical protein
MVRAYCVGSVFFVLKSDYLAALVVLRSLSLPQNSLITGILSVKISIFSTAEGWLPLSVLGFLHFCEKKIRKKQGKAIQAKLVRYDENCFRYFTKQLSLDQNLVFPDLQRHHGFDKWSTCQPGCTKRYKVWIWQNECFNNVMNWYNSWKGW